MGRSGGSGLFFRYAEAVPAHSGGAKNVEKSGQLAVEFGKKVGHRMPEDEIGNFLTIAETRTAASIEGINASTGSPMALHTVQKLFDRDGPGEDYFVSPEKLVRGNPKQTLWTQYTDASGKFFAGVWRSEPGMWTISYTEEEYCHMLEGVSVITGADGQALTVRAGDIFVIPRGFLGTWEVVDRTTKRFVICEASD